MDCLKGVEDCRNKDEALRLKIAAIVAILVACVVGVCMPIMGRYFRTLRAESNLFFVMKSFAAGVILSTGFVHMLPDAFDSLTNPCLPESPWSHFPFAGFIAMVAALLTLMIDFWGTAYYERKQAASERKLGAAVAVTDFTTGRTEASGNNHGSDADEENGTSLPMVAIHAHATSHTHSLPEAKGTIHPHNHGHAHGHSEDSKENSQLRHKVISQVLELGIVAHSVIIGISMGTSQSPCTIRPLVAALSFHQFFEGVALGGCIAQAGFKSGAAAVMAFFFSITTPLGIGIGIGISSIYNENSPRALIVEGVFDSMSAGILVYMSLVDLIATDFLSKRLQSNAKLQIASYTSLFLGAGAMSLIAKWS